MNVNIWGPPTWDLLHSCAFFLDMNKVSSSIFEHIKMLLPCVHCRNSYKDYYLSMGSPSSGSYATWIIHIHNLVNKKLNSQKIDKLIQRFPHLSELKSIEDEFLSNPSELLIKKRFMVSLDTAFTWKSVSLVILAFAMGVQDNKTRQEFNHEELLNTFRLFLKELKKIFLLFKAKVSKQKSKRGLLMPIEYLLKDLIECDNENEIRNLVEEMKYDQISNYKPKELSELIRAYSCFEGTCK